MVPRNWLRPFLQFNQKLGLNHSSKGLFAWHSVYWYIWTLVTKFYQNFDFAPDIYTKEIFFFFITLFFIWQAKGRTNPSSRKKSNSSCTEDKLSTDSDSSSTWRGSSSSFNNNYNNALNDQELCPGLDALEIHASDLSSDNSRHTIPKFVEKNPREKLKRSFSDTRWQL